MFYRIDGIESGMIECLTAAKPDYLRFVGSYGGELMGDWQAVIRALPAVWVAFQGMTDPKPCNTAQTRFEARVQFSTVVASRSLRSEATARKGGPAGTPYVGTYQMLEDVAARICMQDFGVDGVDYLRPGRIRTLFTAKMAAQALSVLAQDWTSRVQFTLREPGQRPIASEGEPTESGYLPPSAEPLPELRHLGLRYWLKPPQYPDTDDPLLTDILPRVRINIYEEQK